MPTRQNKINKVSAKKLKALDTNLDGFADILTEVMENLNGQMTSYVSAFKQGTALNQAQVLKAIQAGQALEDITAMIDRSGYNALNTQFINNYDNFTTDFLDQSFKALNVPLEFTALDIELMSTLEGLSLNNALGIGDDLANSLMNGLSQMALGNQSFSDTISFLETLPTTHSGHLKAQVNTGMATFDSIMSGNKYEEAGITKYQYFGPRDKVTRPFDREVFNRQAKKGGFFTLKEIQGELTQLRKTYGQDKGLDPNVFHTRGGWNCRHSWGVFVG